MPKTKPKTNHWILACDGSNPKFPFGFACTRCGAQQSLPSHIPIDVYVAWGKNFTALHKACQEPKPVENQEQPT